jgi:hypothetical protein
VYTTDIQPRCGLSIDDVEIFAAVLQWGFKLSSPAEYGDLIWSPTS